MRTDEVAEGVVRVCAGATNCYVVTTGDGVLLVDAGLPSMWRAVGSAVRATGAAPADVAGLVLTHGHFDHLGFARRAAERGIPVWVHPGDAALLARPYGYRPGRPRAFYLPRPRALPPLLSMVANGALAVRSAPVGRTFTDGETLPLPGSPRVVHTPGHTDGHCVFHLADHGVLLTGDALVTLDPYTGRRGPRVVARAGTKDAEAALASLSRLPGGRALVLPGHGEPWLGEVGTAVAQAREEGVA